MAPAAYMSFLGPYSSYTGLLQKFQMYHSPIATGHLHILFPSGQKTSPSSNLIKFTLQILLMQVSLQESFLCAPISRPRHIHRDSHTVWMCLVTCHQRTVFFSMMDSVCVYTFVSIYLSDQRVTSMRIETFRSTLHPQCSSSAPSTC